MNIITVISNLKAAAAAGVQVKSFSMTETHRGVAWSLKLWFNGKNLGMLSNQGVGGDTTIAIPADQQKEVVAKLKEHKYALDMSYDPALDPLIEVPTDDRTWLEYAACQIGDEMAAAKAFKKKAKTRIYVEKKSEPTLIYYTKEDSPHARNAIQARHGDDFVRFLNDDLLAL